MVNNMKKLITLLYFDSLVIPLKNGTPSLTTNLYGTPSLTTNFISRTFLILICLFTLISNAESQSLYVASGGNISLASTGQTTRYVSVSGTFTAASVGDTSKW